MKDSNPVKKYYRGWDDALGEMAGILQDVYSEEKQKESLGDFIGDFPYSTQKEHKPDIELIQRSWYMEGYHDGEFGKEPRWIIKTGEGGPKYELNPRYGQPLVDEQKPAEWSEDDKLMRTLVIKTLEMFGGVGTTGMQIDWLKSLPERFNPQPKQEWNEEDERMLERAFHIMAEYSDIDEKESEAVQNWLKSFHERATFNDASGI